MGSTSYHVLFTVAQLCEGSAVDPLVETEAKARIPQAIGLLKELVKAEIADDQAFTASRFFKDAKTKSKIQRKIAEAKSSRTTTSRRRPKGRV